MDMARVHQVAVKVSLATGGDDWSMMPRDKFMSMDRAKQINLVLDGRVKFYDDAGGVVPLEDAVSAIGLM